MRYLIGRIWLGVFRWKVVGQLPPDKKFVFIAAPHTSNWDLPFMLSCAWVMGLKASWLGKHTLFEGKFGWFFKALGGVPVDRRLPQGLVAQVVDHFANRDALALAVPAEGKRRYVERWKSGFYHIARGADVPVGLGFLDFDRKRCGLGPVFKLTGDVAADMDKIRAFYEPIGAKFPEFKGPIRLKEEDAAELIGPASPEPDPPETSAHPDSPRP